MPWTTEKMASTSDNSVTKNNSLLGQEFAKFSTSVSVAGLSEIGNAPTRKRALMWCVVVFISLSVMIYVAYITHLRHSNDKEYDIEKSHVYGQYPPFPNVTICTPEAMNLSRVEGLLNITDSIRNQLAELNVTMKELAYYVAKMYSLNVNERFLISGLHGIAENAIENALDSLPNGYGDFIRMARPNCEQTLSNCAYDGKHFDCCLAATFFWEENCACFQLGFPKIAQLVQVDSINQSVDQQFMDLTKLKSSGLTMDISIDWVDFDRFQIATPDDGMHVHIGSIPSPFTTPISIPSGMDAIISLATVIKVEDTQNCWPENNLPNTMHSDYYDPMVCIIETGSRIMNEAIGCKLPSLNDSAGDSPCSPNIFLLGVRAVNGQLEMPNVDRKFLRDVYYNPMCRPICNRWVYETKSASYGSLAPFNSSKWDDLIEVQQNKSWSHLRIFFPEPAYWLQTERPTLARYVELSDIGGILGLYAGFSMVTLAEIVAHGFILMRDVVRKRYFT